MAAGTAIGKIGKIDFFACLPSGAYAFLCLYLAISIVVGLEEGVNSSTNGNIIWEAIRELKDAINKLIEKTSSKPTSLLLVIFSAYLLGSIFRAFPVNYAELLDKFLFKNHKVEFPYSQRIINQIEQVACYTNATQEEKKSCGSLIARIKEIEEIEEKIKKIKKDIKNKECYKLLIKQVDVGDDVTKLEEKAEEELKLENENEECPVLMVHSDSFSNKYAIAVFNNKEANSISFDDPRGELSEKMNNKQGSDSKILQSVIRLLDCSHERSLLAVYNHWKCEVCINTPDGFSFYQEFEARTRFFSSLIISGIFGFFIGIIGIVSVLKISLSLSLLCVLSLGIALIFGSHIKHIREQESQTLTGLYLVRLQKKCKSNKSELSG